jgi:hypothetical protein
MYIAQRARCKPPIQDMKGLILNYCVCAWFHCWRYFYTFLLVQWPTAVLLAWKIQSISNEWHFQSHRQRIWYFFSFSFWQSICRFYQLTQAEICLFCIIHTIRLYFLLFDIWLRYCTGKASHLLCIRRLSWPWL